MKIPQLLVMLSVFAGVVLPLIGQTSNGFPDTVAPGATLKQLSHDLSFAEGPSCDKDGNLFFTDQPNNRIMKYSTDGKLTVFLEPSGRANGMNFDSKGNLLACSDEKTELWSIAPDGTHTVLAHEYNGKPLCGPNDVWNMPNGGLYITDPFYARNWWTYRQRPQDKEEVYYLGPDRKELKRVTDDLNKPNGIVGAPDGKTLYVSDIGANQTFAYDPQPDGTLANKRLVCRAGSDGMTMDENGNLYLDRCPGRHGFRQDRQPNRPHPHPGGLDGQHLFRWQRQEDPVHHREPRASTRSRCASKAPTSRSRP